MSVCGSIPNLIWTSCPPNLLGLVWTTEEFPPKTRTLAADNLENKNRDMYFEKLGFLLTFWNMAGVPFTYCHCALYLANHDPSEYRWSALALGALVVVYLFMYWMWDTANSHKNSFRQMERDRLIRRNTFPQLPWQYLDNPKAIETDAGDRILVDGWFGIIRKPNYVPDMFFAFSWGLICGFK